VWSYARKATRAALHKLLLHLRILDGSLGGLYDILIRSDLENRAMSDIVFIALGCAFFAVAIFYTYGCDKLSRSQS
jgi:1,4-dihydroxy-2-naphthoate octaprenyltransferase